MLRGNNEPDEATLAGWAAEVAANISMTPEMVRAIWTDYMADRGLLKGSEKYQRHLLICAFRNQAPRRWKAVTEKFPYFSDTRAAHGMWHRAHPSVPPCGVKKA